MNYWDGIHKHILDNKKQQDDMRETFRRLFDDETSTTDTIPDIYSRAILGCPLALQALQEGDEA